MLKAQELGLNICWAAMTNGKSAAEIGKGEKLSCVIALGYGAAQGTAHPNKPLKQLCNCASDIILKQSQGIRWIGRSWEEMEKQVAVYVHEDRYRGIGGGFRKLPENSGGAWG